MKIFCLIKFVPDVNEMIYDWENNSLIRDNVKTIMNPDDEKALALALKIKKIYGGTVEIVTMSPISVMNKIRDAIRIGVDKVTLITDKSFVGSDTYVTSNIISSYLKNKDIDLIITGTYTIDGDTSHVPAQIAEIMDYSYMSGITYIKDDCISKNKVICTVESDEVKYTYALTMPAVMGISKEMKIKLPYVSYKDLNRYVDNQIEIISNQNLKLSEYKIGLKGSKTKVISAYARTLQKKEHTVVTTDEEGIEFVYQFLKRKGFINDKKSDDIY